MELQLCGKTLRLKFGMHVAEFMADLFNDELGAIDKSAKLISLAHVNYVKANVSEVVQLNEREIYAAIEDATLGQDAETVANVGKVWQAFTDSPLVKSLLQKVDEITKEEPKKKAPGKTLKSSHSA